MVALPRFQGVNPHIIAIGGVGAASIVAAIVLLMPTDMLETAVSASGVAALVSAAQPPLGITARAVLAIAAGGMAGIVCWSVLYLLVGPGGFLIGAALPRAADAAPVLRRADAHPDAPPRRPISAADLGRPMMAPSAPERALPRDLEQPLAAFDPAAIPATPRAPVPAVPPLPRPQPDARIETFALPPVPTPPRPHDAAPPKPDAAPAPSIEALLRRLEQGANARLGAR